jgi:RimJ/RimL family protein N-acetyltransferase
MMLRHDHVLLRLWEIADAPWYVAARDAEVLRWTTEPAELSVAAAEEAIRAAKDAVGVAAFAIVDATRQQLVGNIACVYGVAASAGEVMYWLAPEGRGRGIATIALRLVSAWALAQPGIERVLLKTHPANVRSQGVAERAGFRRTPPPHTEQATSEAVWYVFEPDDI